MACSLQMTNEWSIKDKTVLVTGSNVGIGRATAIELARLGAKRVILACRNLEQAQEVVDEILKTTSAQSTVYHLDLSSIASVQKCYQQILENEIELHVLINNAGIFGPSTLTKSVDGYELTFATNYLGHFCLTIGLLDLLTKSAPSRIVNVSTGTHNLTGKPEFLIDPNFEESPEKYNRFTVYSYSKLATVLFTRLLHKKLVDSGRSMVTTYAPNPGFIASEISRDYHWIIQKGFKFLAKSPEHGCRSSVYCATQPGIELLSSGYFYNCQQEDPGEASKDEAVAEKLWVLSEKFVRDSGN